MEDIAMLKKILADLQNQYDKLQGQYKSLAEDHLMFCEKNKYILTQYRKRYKWLNWLFYPEEKGK